MSSANDVEAAQVRELAAGSVVEGLEVIRCAVRVNGDRQLLVTGGRSWWIARHVAGRTSICAYIGDVEADEDFDFYLTAPSARGAWSEVAISREEPAA